MLDYWDRRWTPWGERPPLDVEEAEDTYRRKIHGVEMQHAYEDELAQIGKDILKKVDLESE